MDADTQSLAAKDDLTSQDQVRAIEDALVLANVLNSSSSADAALDRFVAQREPRVRWVRDRAYSTIAMLAQAE